ncbi:3-deoxy-manno-octulosonate cytidylyltransferase [Hippea jasoniae]|uniref:3-deoxy-manno-octulosonate cytidylyltransferase n=1 Tax=Hippea jasoniae TaxID=944479 RepID=UPI000550A598|nr:3-deoxy-manno-octulosonate cytidylyltransferase [Hippea jasoniae]
MKTAVLIPARFASERFKGKVLVDIKQKPMVEWVYEAAAASCADFVAVLTDDKRVYDAVKMFGGEVFLVDGDFNSGSDRVAYFVKDKDFDIVVNLQADEPLIDGKTIDLLIDCLKKSSADIATLVGLCSTDEVDDRDVVKVVVDKNGFALYFSRLPIPYNRKPFESYLKHIGIYAYKRDVLIKLSSMEVDEIEKAEGLEQLRALRNGFKIKTCFTDKFLIGVDTKKDLERLLEYLDGKEG